MAQLKVLQSIEPGLWQVRTRTEPAPKQGAASSAPEQGCLTAQDIAEDLQAFLAQDDSMSCKGLLQTNSDELAVLQLSCPVPSKEILRKSAAKQSLFKAPPAVIEVRRFSSTHFQVSSKGPADKSAGRKASSEFTTVQDYERLDDCPW